MTCEVELYRFRSLVLLMSMTGTSSLLPATQYVGLDVYISLAKSHVVVIGNKVLGYNQ